MLVKSEHSRAPAPSDDFGSSAEACRARGVAGHHFGALNGNIADRNAFVGCGYWVNLGNKQAKCATDVITAPPLRYPCRYQPNIQVLLKIHTSNSKHHAAWISKHQTIMDSCTRLYRRSTIFQKVTVVGPSRFKKFQKLCQLNFLARCTVF